MGVLGRNSAGAAARGADDWVERVRAASDIAEVVGQTVRLKRVGRNWVGLCPFHEEKSPSFSVNADRQFYHCFGCKAGGDVFKFIQETEHLGFLEAVELLSRRAGIPVPERRDAGPRGQRTPLLEALEAAASAYQHWLGDLRTGARARAYLEERGLDRDTIQAFRLGLAPEGWEHLVQRLKSRFPEDVLVGAGLASRRETGRGGIYDRFRDRLMVPLVAPGGAVVGFGARSLGKEEPKYLNSPESAVYHKGAFLFALDQARKHVATGGELIVVEGYFDTIALHQAGLRHCVATSGTALTAEQAKLLKRLSGRVALTYDGDAAGQDAMLRSLGVLLSEGLEVLVVDLPEGDDPDTLVRRDGVEGWRRVREAAYDPIEFVHRHVLRARERSGDSGDSRARALQRVVELGAGVNDPIQRRLLVERASEVFGLELRVLARAIDLRRSGQRSDQPVAAAVRAERRGEAGIERRLLGALLRAPEALESARQRLSPEDFRDLDCGALALWLWGGGQGLPEEEPAAGLARELLAADGERDWNEEARGGIRQLIERRLRQQKKELDLQLHRAQGGPEEARILKAIREIARALEELSG